jgi:hypothetical protein
VLSVRLLPFRSTAAVSRSSTLITTHLLHRTTQLL